MNFSNKRVLDQYLALSDKPFLLQYFDGCLRLLSNLWTSFKEPKYAILNQLDSKFNEQIKGSLPKHTALKQWLLHISHTSVQKLKSWGENTISNLKSCLQLTFSVVCTPMCLYTLMCKYLPKVYNTIYGSWFLVIQYLPQKFKEFQ